MQIHRNRHARGFTIVPNAILQDRRLSYTARGLLTDLLSRPDGWREDGRRMAETSPQGRIAITKALRELTAFGYYRVIRLRRPDGTFVSEAHVYDTPQPTSTPDARQPGPGHPATGCRGINPVKDVGKPPSLPAQRSRPGTPKRAEGQPEPPASPVSSPAAAGSCPGGPPAAADPAAALLSRLINPEPRLRLGTVETSSLAPLVEEWLERGYGQHDLTAALLEGLPQRVHSPAALLRDRLTRKLPPPRDTPKHVTPRWPHECDTCGRPTDCPGLCGECANGETALASDSASVRPFHSGLALVRAALSGRPPKPRRSPTPHTSRR